MEDEVVGRDMEGRGMISERVQRCRQFLYSLRIFEAPFKLSAFCHVFSLEG